MTETIVEERQRPAFYSSLRGILTTTHHTDIGILYIATSFFFFILGGVAALLIRTQLAEPGNAVVTPEIYDSLFTTHGTTMIFLWVIPCSDRNQQGMDLVRCINRNLLATATPTPETQRLMGHVQTLEFDCYDGMQWRNTWDTSLTDTNLPVAVRVRIQLAARPGEDASKLQPLEMLVPLVSQTRTNLTAGGTQ